MFICLYESILLKMRFLILNSIGIVKLN